MHKRVIGAKLDKIGRISLFPSKAWAVNKVQYETGLVLPNFLVSGI